MLPSDVEHVLVTSFGAEGERRSVERVVVLPDAADAPQRIGWWLPDGREAEARFAGVSIVSVQPCRRNGEVILSEPVREGRVQVLTSGADFDEVKAAVERTHGLSSGLSGLVDKVRERFSGATPEACVVIDLVG